MENTRTAIVTALTRVSVRAIITLASAAVFLGIVGGALPGEFIEEAGALTLVTTAFYFGRESS